MKKYQDKPPADQEASSFKRGSTWLRKTGIGHTGKKAKRLIHRRDRHEARKFLQSVAI